MLAIALALGTPFFIIFGWLSDQVGRKPIMLLGFALAVVTYASSSPVNSFKAITHYANPALENALASAPVRGLQQLREMMGKLELTVN